MEEGSAVDRMQHAIYWRGMLVQRYAAVEFSLTQLIADARRHPSYERLGDVPGTLSSKLHRAGQLTKTAPIAQFRHEINNFLAEFRRFEDYRHFMVHGLMVPSRNGTSIELRMFKHIVGEFVVGDLTLLPEHLESLAEAIQLLSSGFTEFVSKVCHCIIADAASTRRCNPPV